MLQEFIPQSEGKLELVEDLLKKYTREYSWAELTAKDKPKGLDNTQLESYLSDAEFKDHFGMTKDEFWKMPVWKQTQKKKQIGFF